ncbi:MAG: acetylxylan esterase [Chlorobi bacterium]|nr:acetylxylan esterase [Chlorobiota bacterium]
MKKIISLISFVIAVFILSGCNTAGKKNPAEKEESIKPENNLCVGECMTPEQGKAMLDSLASVYHNVKEWEARVSVVKKGFWKNSKLDEIPDSVWNRPFNAIVRSKRVMDGYTVENIAIEGMPGHFITGNLYKPVTIKGKIPAIASPHGHWYAPGDYGRFRPDVQYRCASFARMGAVVFAYDMVGFGENTTCRHDTAAALTMQTYNSKRVIDYLCSLNEVDTTRIGVTGASGGGTQTIYISLIDPRVKVSVPVVMVSSFFYGGCICESGLPVARGENYATNLADMAAMFAPKPLLFVTDGHDWTRTAPTVEYPYIRNVYKLYGAEDNVENAHLPNEFHSYGFEKRKPVYPFMAKHLGLDLSKVTDKYGNIDESHVTLLPVQELKVFPDKPIAFVTHCCSSVEYSMDSPLYNKKN